MAMFWLVATQHCGLEAAGVLSQACGQADGTHGCDTEHADGCDVVEGGAFKTSSGPLKISGPQLVICIWLIRARAANPELERKVEVSRRQYAERPRDWVPGWQFVQRTALSPRAPSLV